MPKILAIDDINDNLISLKAIIDDTFPDAVVFTALNGQKGIELALANNPDVILLDVIMPGMDGFEVCRLLKLDEQVRDIPVVFLTALRGDKENRIKALEVGAEGFLSKPIDETELTAQIRAMLKIKAANEQKRNEKDLLKTLVAERTRELENSQAQLKGIFENLQDAYFQVDLSGHFTVVSPSAVTMYGFESIDEIIGQPAEMLYFDLEDRNSMLSVLRSAGRVKDFVCQARKKDGSPFWVSMNVQLISGSDGQILGTEGVVRDISERKQAEESVRDSEERFRHISSSISDISYSCVTNSNGNTTIDWLYGATEKITGYTLDELFAMKCWGKLVIEEDFPIFKSHILKVSPGQSGVCQLRLKKKDGSLVWIQATAECVNGPDGEDFNLLYGGLVDITHRKQAEEALKESEARFRNIFSLSPDSIAISEVETGKYVEVSPSFEKLSGYNRDEIIGRTSAELGFWIEMEDRVEYVSRLKKYGEVNDLEINFKNNKGNIVHTIASTRLISISGKSLMLNVIKDITERKLAEKKLQESEVQFREFFEKAADAIFIADIETGILVDANEAASRLLLMPRNQIIGLHQTQLHPPDKEELSKETFHDHKKTVMQQEIAIPFENYVIRSDGSLKPVEILAAEVLYKGKKCLLGTFRDITERTQAEKALRESEEKYRRMVDLLPDAIIIHTEGKVAFANAAAQRIIGLSSHDQLIGQSILDFIHPDCREPIIKRIKQIYETGEPSGFAEEKFITFDNKVIDAEVIGIPVSYKGKPAIQTILRDITKRKRAEEALWESQLNFKALFEKGPIGVAYHQMIYDETGKPINYLFLDANQSYQKLTGVNPVGKLVTEAFPGIENDPFDWIGTFGEVAKTGKEIRFQQYLQTNNRWYDCVGYQYKPDHFVAAFFEITEKRMAEMALQESNELNNTLLKTIPFGMDIVDEQGNILFQSENMENVFSKTAIGCKCWDLYRDDKIQCLDCPLLSGIEIGKTDTYESSGVLGGRTFQISHTGLMFKGKKAMLEIFQDITESKEAELALQESESRYKSFISQVTEGVYRFECDVPMDVNIPVEEQIDYIYDHFFIAECNDAILQMYKLKDKSEFIGKTHLDFHGGRNNPVNRALLRNFIINGYSIQNGITEEFDSTGQLRYISNNSVGIIENNHLVRLWGTESDLTEKMRADRVQQVLYSISNAALSSIDLSELIKLISKEIGKLLDSTNFYIAFHNEETDMLSTIYERDEKDVFDSWPAEKSITGYVIKHQKSMRITYDDVQKLCDTGEIEMFGTPSKVWLGVPLATSKKVIGALVVQSYDDPEAYTEKDKQMLEFISHQISVSIERKKAEQELNEALVKAQESDRLKSAFLANMSHEIRTPLNSIIGFSELMTDPDFDFSQQFDFAKMINASGTNLLAIINDIMDISKIETGQVQVKIADFSVDHLIADIQKEYSFNASMKGVELILDPSNPEDETVLGSDENKIRQVLVNLVGNAIKFTKDGLVEIGIRHAGEFVQFHVRDTGIGIPKEYHHQIFERFRQVESADSRRYGGNGLGLAISKSLVELLGGKIWMESGQGKGSTFYFTIPIH